MDPPPRARTTLHARHVFVALSTSTRSTPARSNARAPVTPTMRRESHGTHSSNAASKPSYDTLTSGTPSRTSRRPTRVHARTTPEAERTLE